MAKHGQDGQDGQNGQSMLYPEISANAVHVLIGVAAALLNRQVASLAAAFEKEGGFTERLYKTRRIKTTFTETIVK